MIGVLGHVIKPTIFPDGTVQVWKLSDELIEKLKSVSGEIEVYWEYQSDSELVPVLQLAYLIENIVNATNNFYELVLNCPFLPYGRQDKDVSNTSCFGLNVFMDLVFIKYNVVKTVDVHNPSFNFTHSWYRDRAFENTIPFTEINKVITQLGIDVVLFPDKGAAARYNQMSAKEVVIADKVRNQLTGEIVGIQIFEPYKLTGKNVLVVDDICDGGRTFIELAAEAKKYTPLTMSLWTTHGIYSKGKDCLYQAGYKTLHNIFELRKQII